MDRYAVIVGIIAVTIIFFNATAMTNIAIADQWLSVASMGYAIPGFTTDLIK